MAKVVVIIPIYKESMTKEEEASLKQCIKVLGEYPIRFVCPENLNISMYNNFLACYDINVEFVKFKSDYFSSIIKYNQLMLSLGFYQRFSDYQYMLIYQLDAWVFGDELEYWCSSGYDYIGAPWFVGYNNPGENPKLHQFAGNGGFSLRKIESFIKVLSLISSHKYDSKRIKTIYELDKELQFPFYKKFKILKKYFSKKNSLKYFLDNVYEDIVIVNCFKCIDKNFKLPISSKALKFSFEVNPEILFEMNNKKLPFGCHAFKKYNYDFWKNYIKIE